MHFLPAIPLLFVKRHVGNGGIAVNADGTLMASVNSVQHCVYIYSMDSTDADPIICSTFVGGQLHYPQAACFVYRSGVETLIIEDWYRLVEITVFGAFIRIIPLRSFSSGIAYCAKTDVIAVVHPGIIRMESRIVLLQYTSGALIAETAYGQLTFPTGVTFTVDGDYFLVTDSNKHLSKFRAATGAFISRVASRGDGVLDCEDGTIIVTRGFWHGHVVSLEADGVTSDEILFRNDHGDVLRPFSLSYSSSLMGVVVKCMDGSVFLLRDAWVQSSRCAWLLATVDSE